VKLLAAGDFGDETGEIPDIVVCRRAGGRGDYIFILL
jgi:hypothetical protein